MSEAVVVTGLGAVCPLGTGAREVWASLLAERSGVRALLDDDERRERGVDPSPPAAAPGTVAGWVRGFRPREHVGSSHLRRMDWCSRMLVAAVRQAFADAGLLPLDPELAPRAALVVGSAYGNQRETEQYLGRILDSGLGAAQPMLFPNLVLNAGAGYAAIELDVQGPNLCVAQHEASGEAALVTALELLRAGACDVVCAAGVDETSRVVLDALADVRLLHRDALPTDRQRRAPAHRDGGEGFVPGEGAAALVLESATRAEARAARPYARLAAARVGSVPAPAYAYPRDPEAAARRLLELARVPGAPIDGLVAGASGVGARDRIEAAVLRLLGEPGAAPPGCLPFKRLVGDFASAGALAAVLAALALEARLLPGGPPFAGLPGAAARVEPQRLLIAGLARGGVLAPVVLERAAP